MSTTPIYISKSSGNTFVTIPELQSRNYASKFYIDSALAALNVSSGADTDSVVQRDSAGRFAAAQIELMDEPEEPNHAATKAYVDGKIVEGPDQTPDAVPDTLVIRDENADASFNDLTVNSLKQDDDLLLHTHGTNNTGVGRRALRNRTFGARNTGAGHQALDKVTTGNNNTACGSSALATITTTSNNTAIGYNCLYLASGGDSNTAVGANVGGALYGNSNTLIGASTGVHTNSATNATALGYQAQTTANNQVKLGNNSVTSVLTSGIVTANGLTTTGNVSCGGLTMADGTQQNGRVLTCDGNGQATWQNLPPEPYMGDWNSSINYKKNEQVTINGALYLAVNENQDSDPRGFFTFERSFNPNEAQFGSSYVPEEGREFGTKFCSTVTSTFRGFRVYLPATSDLRNRSMSLWSESGTLLASATATNLQVGKNIVLLDEPYSLETNTWYMASFSSFARGTDVPAGSLVVETHELNRATPNWQYESISIGQFPTTPIFTFRGLDVIVDVELDEPVPNPDWKLMAGGSSSAGPVEPVEPVLDTILTGLTPEFGIVSETDTLGTAMNKLAETNAVVADGTSLNRANKLVRRGVDGSIAVHRVTCNGLALLTGSQTEGHVLVWNGVMSSGNWVSPAEVAGTVKSHIGTDNTFAGEDAGNMAGSSSAYSVAMGKEALSAITTGQNNSALGWRALKEITTGSRNTSFGSEANSHNTWADDNTAIGHNALMSVSSSKNTVVGSEAGKGIQGGPDNVVIGYNAGLTPNSSGYNTLIGSGANVNSGTVTNSCAIGYGAQATANNQIRLGNTSVTDVVTSGTINASSFSAVGGRVTAGRYLGGLGTAFSSPFTGALVSATAQFVTCRRMGDNVLVSISAFEVSSSSGTVATLSTAIPTEYRPWIFTSGTPSTTEHFPCMIKNNGSLSMGMILINSEGTVTLQPLNGSFSGVSGLPHAVTLSYIGTTLPL